MAGNRSAIRPLGIWKGRIGKIDASGCDTKLGSREDRDCIGNSYADIVIDRTPHEPGSIGDAQEPLMARRESYFDALKFLSAFPNLIVAGRDLLTPLEYGAKLERGALSAFHSFGQAVVPWLHCFSHSCPARKAPAYETMS
jgi:hypothetical protein